MNNVKFVHTKTKELVVVKVCQPSADVMSKHWTSMYRSLKPLLMHPTLARAHQIMLAAGYVRQNSK